MGIDQTYKLIFDSSPIAVLITDEAGIIQLVNKEATKLFGYNNESIKGKEINNVIPQSLPAFSFKHRPFPDASSTNDGLSGELYARHENGAGFPVELSTTTFEADNKKLISWFVKDISATKKLLDDLKERVKEQLTLLRVTEILFKTDDLEHVFRESLAHIRDGWQYPEYTTVCISLADGQVFCTDDFHNTPWGLSTTIECNGKPYGSLEVYYKIEFPYYGDSPFLQEEKHLIEGLSRLFSLYLDQWFTVKKLRESEALIRKITDQVPVNTYQFKISSSGVVSVLFSSKGLNELNYKPADEKIRKSNQNPFQAVHPDDVIKFRKSMKKAQLTLNDVNIQYRVILDNTESWRWLRARPEKTEAGSVIWYGSSQDITQIVEYIDIIEQILSDISHVMRRPVVSMLGLSNLIEDDYLTEHAIKDYAKNFKAIATEMDEYMKKLNDVYSQKRLKTHRTNQHLFNAFSDEKWIRS